MRVGTECRPGGFDYVEWLDREERASGERRLAAWCFLLSAGESKGYPTVSQHRDEQAAYVAQRLNGQTHKWAEMVATASPPGCLTDSVFLEGHCNGSQFERTPALGDHYKKVAEANGQSVTGKVYLSGLAAFPGDPRAWVSGRGDVAKVLDERGWGAEGAVSRKVQKVGERRNVGLAEDLVEDEMLDIMAAAGDHRDVDYEAEREKVVARRKPHWAD